MISKIFGNRLLSAFALGASLSIAAGPTFASQDVLAVPALKSELAASSVLLDLTPAGDRLVAIGERGHILYSEDNGQSWNQADVPVSVLLTAIDFVDANNGWAVGHGAIVLRTSDGGKTWSKQFDGNAANQMVIAEAQDRVSQLEDEIAEASEEDAYDIEMELEEAQFALEDAEYDAELGPSKPLLDVWFEDTNTGFVVGAYGFFFKTEDGGQTWENWGPRLDNQERFHLNAIAQITGGAMFVVGEAGLMYRSVDLGETWERLESPYDGSFFGVSGNGNVNEVLAYGLRGNLFYSVNTGDSWRNIDTGTESTLMSASVGDRGKVAVVGNSGVLLLSNDFGASYRTHVQEDRLAILAVHFTSGGKILLVGEGGVSLIDSTN